MTAKDIAEDIIRGNAYYRELPEGTRRELVASWQKTIISYAKEMVNEQRDICADFFGKMEGTTHNLKSDCEYPTFE